MSERLKTRADLKAEGKPFIRYTKDGKNWREQIFITEKSCKIRTKELIKMGFTVERVQ